jgi:Tfp pilus assembly protein PilF
MALFYDNSGELDLAVKEYEDALKFDRDNPLIHLNFAVTLIRKNEITRARDELSLSIKLDPEATEPHAVLALLNLTEGKLDLAAMEYEIALKNASKLNPKNVEVYKSLGALYLRQGNVKKAEETYRFISELAPSDPEVHFYLGVVYGELNNNVLLEKELKKAISLKPDYAEALNFLGYIYVERNKNFKVAENLIKRALKVDSDNGAYHDSLGWLYYKRGKIKEAKEALEKAASLVSDPGISDHLGDVFFKMKDTANARLNWEESLRLNPLQESVEKKIEGLKNK